MIEIKHIGNQHIVEYFIKNKPIGKCKIDTYKNKWSITEWFVDHDFQNMGVGRRMMRALLKHLSKIYGLPQKVEYIWNGTNRYVMDWLEDNFDAKCIELPAVLKQTEESGEDTVLSHVYDLNVAKIIEYFELNH